MIRLASKVDVDAAKEMLAHGWGVKDVAEKFGVSRQQIWRMLQKSKKKPKPKPPRGKRTEGWQTENRNLTVDTQGQFLPAGRVADNEQMEAIAEGQLTSPIYSKDINPGDKIGILVNQLTRDLADVGEAIRFEDTEMLRRVTIRYLVACEKKGVIPSSQGLSRAFGVTNSAMKQFMRRHPDHPSARFLEIVLDGFSDTLQQATLSGSVKEVYSIFLQKALYNLRDNAPIQGAIENPIGEAESTSSIADKYANIDD